MPPLKDLIWLIDDDEQLADIVSLALETQGFEVMVSRSADQAMQLLSARGDLKQTSAVLLDLRLADQDGLTLLPSIREELPEVPVFVITAHGDVDSAVEAFTLGASGYIRKPFEEGELTGKLRQAIDQYRLKREVRALRAAAAASSPDHDKLPRVTDLIPSRDPAMSTLLKRVEMAANVTSNCVIHGESGTGKELVARALHQLSPRREGPFIAFNCAALPESLMESELFGHARGAFTDAKEAKAGLFARANGGTLFLDEIGDAPLTIQAKLLRVLQEREVLPIGATQPIKVDVRVVAATHKCLKTEVEQKRFRLDLYYRLHVIRLEIPALRDRKRDILFLGSFFAEKLAREMNLMFRGFTEAAQNEMNAYDWPGNVRELQNRIEQAMALGGGGILPSRHLFPEKEPLDSPDLQITSEQEPHIGTSPGTRPESAQQEVTLTIESLPSYQEAKIDFERNYLERVLQAAKGNIAKASRLASKSRTEVYGLLRKHGLNPVLFKTSEESERDAAN